MIRTILAAALLVGLAGCKQDAPASGAEGSTKSAAAVIRVTGIPDENPTELARKNKPLTDYLAAKLGAPVEYVPVTDYGAAVEAMRAGKVDFAWFGGFTFVQARALAGAVPLTMRAIDREFQSVFVANVAAGIEAPEDMRGKKFAFGSKSSTSGHLMPLHFLQTVHKIDPAKDFDGEPVFSGAHDATVKAVESGRVQVGALNILVWKRMVEEGKVDTSKVKVVWTTPPYVDYVWAAGKDVPEDIQKKFTEAFLTLDGSKEADKAVLALQDAERFVPAKPDDFDAVEKVARSTGLLQ